MRTPTVATLGGCALLVLLAAGTAAAQVDCSDAADLCTGDPCVVPSLEVDADCVLDFGTRALVIDGVLGVPCGGVLSLTAGSIEVRGRIDGDPGHVHPCPSGLGPDVALVAAGDVEVAGDIDASAGVNPEGITIDAGGALIVDARLLAKGLAGGRLQLSADSTILLRAPMNASGCAADVMVTSNDSIIVTTQGRVLADAGNAVCGTGPPAVLIDAATFVQVFGNVRSRGGRHNAGGTIRVRGAVAAAVHGRVESMGSLGGELIVVESSAGDVVVTGRLNAATPHVPFGSSPAGIELQAADLVHVSGIVQARSNNPPSVLAGGGNMLLEGTLSARPSGTIEAVATADLTASGHFRTAPDGCLALAAGGTLDTTGGRFDEAFVADCP